MCVCRECYFLRILTLTLFVLHSLCKSCYSSNSFSILLFGNVLLLMV
uniref:4b protein n=1 Tax=Infectious bronchitis virus TaxID=11120 RepID=A0A1L5YN90_9GAMC|nr:4b protein [Infectious bronchitis virus]